MSRTKSFSFLSVALAAAFALPLTQADTAQADVRVRVRASAGARVSVPGVRIRARPTYGHYRVRPRIYRPYRSYYGTPGYGVRLHVGGSLYWGSPYYYSRQFAAPPPPAAYDCGQSVPSYHTPQTAYAPAPTVISGPAPAPLPDLPRFGIGAFLGGIDAQSSPGASDVGLLGRVRLTERLSLEAEVAKTEIEDGSRIDRRLGGAVLFDLAPRSTWSVHLLGGAGVQQVEVRDDAWRSAQEYAELGAGLTYRLSHNLSLSADIRAGARAPVDEAAPVATRTIAPSSEREDGYTRGRLSAVLHF